MLGMVGVVGCGSDNAAEGAAASKKLGEPGTPDPKGMPSQTITPPSSETDRATQEGPGGSILQQSKKHKAK
jgi:hypothetical protein